VVTYTVTYQYGVRGKGPGLGNLSHLELQKTSRPNPISTHIMI
jgi:hypothetical protein